MNERIFELAKQAELIQWDTLPSGARTPDHESVVKAKKFARLIIRECIQTLRDNTPVVDEHDSVEDWDRGYIRGMVDCEHHIKEHFGVEE